MSGCLKRKKQNKTGKHVESTFYSVVQHSIYSAAIMLMSFSLSKSPKKYNHLLFYSLHVCEPIIKERELLVSICDPWYKEHGTGVVRYKNYIFPKLIFAIHGAKNTQYMYM